MPNSTWVAAPSAELRAVCGPRFNTLALTDEERDRPGEFFQPKVGTDDRRRAAHHGADDDVEGWDGLA